MSNRNYAILVDKNIYYPVCYTIKQNGTKVLENTVLKGCDLTENQIKELFISGYFKEKPTMQEINDYLDYLLIKNTTIKL
jgi:hypothetical protein